MRVVSTKMQHVAPADGGLHHRSATGTDDRASGRIGRQRLLAGVSSLVLLGLPFGLATPAWARCSDNAPASGTTVTCDTAAPNPDTQGVRAQPGSTNVTVTIDPGAAISHPSFGVTLGSQSTATNNGTISITGPATNENEGIALGTTGVNSVLTNNGTITSTSQGSFGAMAAFGDGHVITNSAGATITTSGDVAEGMQLSGSGLGSTAINNGTIITTGNGPTGTANFVPAGIHAVGTGSTVINNGAIETRGTFGIGIYTNLGAGISITNTGNITTAGATATGVVLAGAAGKLNNSGTVTTAGAGSIGLLISGANHNVTNSGTVTTAGVEAHGMRVGPWDDQSGGGGTITNTGTITTAGSGAHGVNMIGGTNNLTNSGAIRTSGATSFGVAIESFATPSVSQVTSIVNQAGGVIESKLYTAIATTNGDEIVDNAGTLIGGNGTAVSLGQGTDTLILRSTAVVQGAMDGGTGGANGTRNDTLTFDRFTYTGGSGLLNWETLALTNGSALTLDSDLVMGDSISLTGTVGIDSTSAINAFADRTIRAFAAGSLVTVNNAGTINLSDGVAGSRLTIAGNYVGQGGRVVLDTYLGGDGSPSDVLVISGGAATGTTVLQIVNAGGPGVLTTGNGILVVDAINSATTAVDAFNLGGVTVAAGPYNYTLFRGSRDATNLEAWYLRSRLDCSLAPNDPACPQQPVKPPVDPVNPPVNPPVDPPEGPPDYRQEVSLYTAIPSMALIYGRTMLDTLHERVGEEEQLRGRADLAGKSMANGAWGRVIGLTGDRDGANNGVLGSKGPKFEYSMVAIQLGMDIYRKEHSDGSRDHAGLYGAYGQIYGDVWHYRGGRAGQDKLKAFSVGGYWTHFGAEGWYLDAVLQGTWYDATGRSNRDGLKLNTNGFGLAASLEGGYPFKFEAGWLVEPQVQLVYQHLWLDKSGDAAARVTFKDAESLAGRIGVRLAKTWQNDIRGEATPDVPRKTTMWLRTNLWHEFKGKSRTEFASADGPVGFTLSLGGTSVEITAGMTAQFSRTGSLFWSVGYEIGLDGKSHAYNGKAGLRFNW